MPIRNLVFLTLLIGFNLIWVQCTDDKKEAEPEVTKEVPAVQTTASTGTLKLSGEKTMVKSIGPTVYYGSFDLAQEQKQAEVDKAELVARAETEAHGDGFQLVSGGLSKNSKQSSLEKDGERAPIKYPSGINLDLIYLAEQDPFTAQIFNVTEKRDESMEGGKFESIVTEKEFSFASDPFYNATANYFKDPEADNKLKVESRPVEPSHYLTGIEPNENAMRYKDSDSVPKEFKPCLHLHPTDKDRIAEVEQFKRDYFIDENPRGNYAWIFGYAKTRNLGESDPSRNTFGTDTSNIGTCDEPIWKQVSVELANKRENYVPGFIKRERKGDIGKYRKANDAGAYLTYSRDPSLRAVYVNAVKNAAPGTPLSITYTKENFTDENEVIFSHHAVINLEVNAATDAASDSYSAYTQLSNQPTAPTDTCNADVQNAYTCPDHFATVCTDINPSTRNSLWNYSKKVYAINNATPTSTVSLTNQAAPGVDTCAGSDESAQYTNPGNVAACDDIYNQTEYYVYTYSQRTVTCKKHVKTTWQQVKDALANHADLQMIMTTGHTDMSDAADPSDGEKRLQGDYGFTGEEIIDYDRFVGGIPPWASNNLEVNETLAAGTSTSDTNLNLYGGVGSSNNGMLQCFASMGYPAPTEPYTFSQLYLTANGSREPNVTNTTGQNTTIYVPTIEYYTIYTQYGSRRASRTVNKAVDVCYITKPNGQIYQVGGLRTMTNNGSNGYITTVQYPNDPCNVFCKKIEIQMPSCYNNVLKTQPQNATPDSTQDEIMNQRRRVIMSNVKNIGETAVPTDGAGLLYMSIKGPGSTVFNVRVHHNLHYSYMFGENDEDHDLLEKGPNTFTFAIPFCPQLNHEYEYAVCNVPRNQHYKFGRSDDGAPRAIPDCFNSTAKKWVVSNIRVANNRISGGNILSWAQMASPALTDDNGATENVDGSPPWRIAYQILQKTTFKISPPLTGNKKTFDKKDTYTKACIPKRNQDDGDDNRVSLPGRGNLCEDETLDDTNICDQRNFPKGVRYIKPEFLEFRYYASNTVSEDNSELFLYVDTSKLEKNQWRDGWKFYGYDSGGDPITDNNGQPLPTDTLIPDPAATNSAFNFVKPVYKTDPLWQCFAKKVESNACDESNLTDLSGNGKIDGDDYDLCMTNARETYVIHETYSPLVINVDDPLNFSLSGLDAGIQFIGHKFPEKKGDRFGEYDKFISTAIPLPENPLYGVFRDVITEAYVKTGWVDGSKGDALLVLDLNKNGQIDSSYELFGEGTVMEKAFDYGSFGTFNPGDFASNGFVALDQYDDNGDHVIDAKDAVWEKLQLWQDGKGGKANGVVDDGELLTLASVGITSINSGKFEKMTDTDEYGNKTLYRSSYTYERDGKQGVGRIIDVYFVYDDLTNEARGDTTTLTDEEKKNVQLLYQDNTVQIRVED